MQSRWNSWYITYQDKSSLIDFLNSKPVVRLEILIDLKKGKDIEKNKLVVDNTYTRYLSLMSKNPLTRNEVYILEEYARARENNIEFLKRWKKELEEETVTERDKVYKRIRELILKTISIIAKEQKIDIVLDSRSVLYSSTSLTSLVERAIVNERE